MNIHVLIWASGGTNGKGIHLPVQETWDMEFNFWIEEDALEEENLEIISILGRKSAWTESPDVYSALDCKESDITETQVTTYKHAQKY